MKKLALLLSFIAAFTLTAFSNDIGFKSGSARVQVIHNSADMAAETVDVYLNETLLIDDFMFRTASPFIDAPAGEEFTIAIAGPDSQSAEEAIWTQNYTLEADETYVLIANGIVSPSGYDPVQAFDIYVYAMGREMASNDMNTDVLVFHGATDAPTVDVVETGAGAGTIVDNLMYGDFQGYLELPTANYQLSIRDESGSETVAVYNVPLAALGLEGAALVTVASGFLNPANNSNGPGFGLWVALPAGGALVELGNITSIGEVLLDESSINVYPNPATNNINLDFSLQERANVELSIFDLTGSIVKAENLGTLSQASHNKTINIDDLNSGLYFMSISTEETVITRKFQIIK